MGASLTVYVAYHQEPVAPLPHGGPYLAVCNVRPDGSRPAGFDAYDDDGGLPDRNGAYCELSVQHRLEERAGSKWVGLCHYRRVLLARPPRAPRGEHPGTWLVAGWDWQQPERWAADESSLLAAADGHDWLTPRPYDVRMAGFRSLAEQFGVNHPPELLEQADRVLRDQHPDLEPLLEHLRRSTATPLFNVFLGRRELLGQYGAFLWPLLEACRQGRPTNGAAYQDRWAGFLAERLHGYWLEHVARSQGVRIGTLPLGLLHDAPGRLPLPPLHRRAAALLPPAAAGRLVRLAQALPSRRP